MGGRAIRMRTLWAAVLLLLLGIQVRAASSPTMRARGARLQGLNRHAPLLPPLQAGAGRHSKSSVPHVRSCNYCGKCILDGEAPAPFPMRGSPGGGGRPGSASPSSPTATGTSVPGLQISPVDEEAKKGLPNCTVCRGCNAELRYIKSETVSVTLVRACSVRG